MEEVKSNPESAVPVPASAPTPAAVVPQAAAIPAAAPASAPVPAVKTEMPKTTGKTPGGWNRFAGYNPNAAKNKPKDRDRR